MWPRGAPHAIILVRTVRCNGRAGAYIGRMGTRPDHVKPPVYLSKTTPVPAPEDRPRPAVDPLGRDPVRYGDWELKGIAIDF